MHSLILAMLMDVPIVAATFVLSHPASSSTFTAISTIVFTTTLWIVVALIFVMSRGRLDAQAGVGGRPA